MNDLEIILLAAGKGTRMESDIPKVLIPLSGRPLVFRVLDTLAGLDTQRSVVVVVGYESEKVKKAINEAGYLVKFAKQRKPLGTANAVKTGLRFINKNAKTVLVLYGDDSCLYRKNTLINLLKKHNRGNSPLTLLTLKSSTVSMLGGIERDRKGRIIDVLSYNELLEKGAETAELLCGAFCFDKPWLSKNIKKIKKGKIKGEYPLPVLISFAATEKNYANSYNMVNLREWNSINNRIELKEAEKKLKS